jgi:hypothetical protein
MAEPDFYLIVNEAVPIVYPIKCWVLKKLEYKGRNDYFLVRVNPQILYYDSQERILETGQVILASRYKGKTIANIKEWPVYVNLIKLNKDLDINIYKIEEDNFEIVALGKIYPSVKMVWEEAKKVFKQYKY